jgi:hypothetical protein
VLPFEKVERGCGEDIAADRGAVKGDAAPAVVYAAGVLPGMSCTATFPEIGGIWR